MITSVITSMKNLGAIAIAMHAYHDKHGHFPPATVYSTSGKPLYSWRVALLPFLEQENLYHEFNLDEPWDSPANKKLLAKMPEIYKPVMDGKTKDAHATFYQVCVGAGALWQEDKSEPTTSDAKSGLGNAILVIEAGEAVPWTKPADVQCDPNQPLPKLGGLFADRINVAWGNGLRTRIPRECDEKMLRLAITCREQTSFDRSTLIAKPKNAQK
jgi:hypothetical protein